MRIAKDRKILLSLVMFTLGALLYWWFTRPPAPETVARWTMEAIVQRDARRLCQLMCDAERQYVSEENLKRVLEQMHRELPYLASLSLHEHPYNAGRFHERKLRRAGFNVAPTVHDVYFCYSFSGNQLAPIPPNEHAAFAEQYPTNRSLRAQGLCLRVHVNLHRGYEKRCPLVVQTLVRIVIESRAAKGNMEQLLERIFWNNGVRVAFYDPNTGRVQRIQLMKATSADGKVKYYW
jgi:hypothetical protein